MLLLIVAGLAIAFVVYEQLTGVTGADLAASDPWSIAAIGTKGAVGGSDAADLRSERSDALEGGGGAHAEGRPLGRPAGDDPTR
jgi:hypothetical protein